MEILVLWFLFGLIGMAIGVKKGMNQAIAFVAGVLLGPFALLMGFITPTKKKCPQCAEQVELAAKVCKHCQYKFLAEDPRAAAQKMYECPNCKGLVRGGKTECPHCHKPINTTGVVR